MNSRRKNWTDSNWTPLPDGWIKINVDTSKRHQQSLVSRLSNEITMLESSWLKATYWDCPILATECLTITETTMMATILSSKRYHSKQFIVGSEFHKWQDKHTKGYL